MRGLVMLTVFMVSSFFGSTWARLTAPLETLDEIKAIFAREGMNAWPKLPMRVTDEA